MNKRSALLALCLLTFLHCGGPHGQLQGEAEDTLTVICIANEGFLITGGGKKVLVDALFVEHDYYDVPSAGLMERMIEGKAPFDNVDLVLATHDHADHFDALTVAAFLRNHPESVFLSTPQAVEDMKNRCTAFDQIADRVQTLDLRHGTSAERTIQGMRLWIHNSGHSGNRPQWQNFMYSFDIGDRTVFHEGDSSGDTEAYRAFGAEGKSADLAFLHSWLMTDERGLKIVREDLKAGRVILMHIPVQFREETLEKLARIRTRFPETYWLETGPDERTFRWPLNMPVSEPVPAH